MSPTHGTFEENRCRDETGNFRPRGVHVCVANAHVCAAVFVSHMPMLTSVSVYWVYAGPLYISFGNQYSGLGVFFLCLRASVHTLSCAIFVLPTCVIVRRATVSIDALCLFF